MQSSAHTHKHTRKSPARPALERLRCSLAVRGLVAVGAGDIARVREEYTFALAAVNRNGTC